MSAWIASDKHIASIVVAIIREEKQQEVADLLKRENIRSVNYCYNERTKITPCDLSQAEKFKPVDVVMLATSLDYQSCERPDWRTSKAYRELNVIRAEAGYLLAKYVEDQGLGAGKWSI